MKQRYLLCPQCGSHRFKVKNTSGDPVYFHVDWNGQPTPTATSQADLEGLDFSSIACCGCSWSGAIRKLVKVFCG